MNLFVTGTNSFVGKVLISELKKNPNYKIYGCDLKVKKNKQFISADIRDKNIFKKIPKKIDAIIHLAAISRDKDCSDDLSNCYLTNVIGTMNIIEAAKILNIKKIIFASTEWVYHNQLAKFGADEKSTLSIEKLDSIYAKSKLLGEYFLRDFYNKFKIDIAILRFGIIYGERDNNWSAVETLFNSIKNNNIVKVGSLKTSRKFIHVEDICHGIIKSLKLKKFNIINLQGKSLVSLKEIIKSSEKILKKKIRVIEMDPYNPSIRNIKSNSSFKKISFRPKIDINFGLIRLKKFFNF